MAPKRKPREQTKVCTCISRKCGTFSFRNQQGETQPGVELALRTIKQHAIEDSLMLRAQNATQALSQAEEADKSDSDSTDSEIAQIDIQHITITDSSNQNPSTLPHASPQDTSDQNRGNTPCAAASDQNCRNSPHEILDCSSLFSRHLLHTHPAVLYSSLVAALCHIQNHCSANVSSYILKSQMELLKITLSHGVLNHHRSRELTYTEKMAIGAIPVDIRTVVNWLRIDPHLNIYISCQKCFAIYDPEKAPNLCTHSYIQQENSTITHPLPKLNPKATSDLTICNEPLFKAQKGRIPIRQYATQDLYHWVARLFSRPDIEEALETSASRSRQPYNPDHLEDIQDSRVWKEFKNTNGNQFTASSHNLVFGIFTDGINPYGNKTSGKHVSVTFIVLVCLSLPFQLRRKPENIFLAGIAPGPHEPSLELVNSIFRPIVDQLITLWNSGLSLSRTYQNPSGRRIFAALLPFFSDLPALRRSLGFASVKANRMCSSCMLTSNEIDNIDSDTWPKRNLEQHRIWATEYQQNKKKKEREDLLEERGVRYSVFLKLEYWNIIEYHVVDSMHNLLLGLLNWHCRRFWRMTEKIESQGIPAVEKSDLIKDNKKYSKPQDEKRKSNKPTEPHSKLGPDLNSNTDPTDMTFDPYALAEEGDIELDFDGDEGWDGDWTAPSEDVIIDGAVLLHINKMLTQIRIPTWIQRAIHILGKASFGRLKADEWRNLFTIQLALILPALWNNPDPEKQSLLHNFAHLVSLVNIALARSTSASRIDAYRYHIKSYLESSLQIFPDVQFAPNHHMAIHLADCLERFGPTRAWWSFPMERLMADILKSPDNNQLSQMEITFMVKFCQIGNLRALLDTPGLPASIQPHVRQLKSTFDPIPFKPETDTRGRPEYLDSEMFSQLIDKLNDKFLLPDKKWVSSTEYCQNDREDRLRLSPVSGRVNFQKNHRISDVLYSTPADNEKNSVVTLKPGLKAAYGQIESIFQHSRPSADNKIVSDIYYTIKPLMPIPPINGNPYRHLSQKYEFPVSLRVANTEQSSILFHHNEILCHCAWIRYKPGELSAQLNFETLAVVSLDRS